MDCTSCATKIENALNRMPGVKALEQATNGAFSNARKLIHFGGLKFSRGVSSQC